jgi:RNA polymerase sigma factor (TIGR02999 family)
MPVVYDELHRLAQRYMSHERPGQTLQASALVNETYVRLADVKWMSWRNRAQFFAVSAQLMRRILVGLARRHRSSKRGGEAEAMLLEEALVVSNEPRADLVALDEAFNALAAINLRRSRVVELRFFGGLTVQETAVVLKVSPETVMHDWKLAKTWLMRELRGAKRHEA